MFPFQKLLVFKKLKKTNIFFFGFKKKDESFTSASVAEAGSYRTKVRHSEIEYMGYLATAIN